MMLLPSRLGKEGREATAKGYQQGDIQTFSSGTWSLSSTVTERTISTFKKTKQGKNGNHRVKYDNQQNKQTLQEI